MPFKRKLEESDSDQEINELEEYKDVTEKEPFWTISGVGSLLNALKNTSSNFLSHNISDFTDIWNEISAEISHKVPWVSGTACKERWEKCKSNVSQYEEAVKASNQDNSSAIQRPDFYFATKMISNALEKLEKQKILGKELLDSEDEECNEEDEADALSGIMDETGILHERDELVAILTCLNKKKMSMREIAQKYDVKDSIVYWVYTNSKLLSKWTFQCKWCHENFSGKMNLANHELKCYMILPYRFQKITDMNEEWEDDGVGFMLDLLKEKTSTSLRNGKFPITVWRGICKEMQFLKPDVTVPELKEKFKLLTEKVKNAEKKTGSKSRLMLKAGDIPYFKEMSAILALMEENKLESLGGIRIKDEPKEEDEYDAFDLGGEADVTAQKCADEILMKLMQDLTKENQLLKKKLKSKKAQEKLLEDISIKIDSAIDDNTKVLNETFGWIDSTFETLQQQKTDQQLLIKKIVSCLEVLT